MARIVSVFLPFWPAERVRRKQAAGPPGAPPDPAHPLVLLVKEEGALRLKACDAQARALGLTPGLTLAGARARVSDLETMPFTPDDDARALQALALWARRYAPGVSSDGDDGFCIDVTGAAHLFGGERKLLADLSQRLTRFGFSARLAIAGSYGAAHALARFGADDLTFCPEGAEPSALKPLPVAALRLSAKTVSGLGALGLKTIASLCAQPRKPLAARFGEALLLRLDQALGRAAEARALLAEPALYRARALPPEPVLTEAAAFDLAGALAARLGEDLTRDGKGARQFTLTLYRADGRAVTIEAQASRALRDPAAILRLFRERVKGAGDALDPGFGYDTLTLEAFAIEPVSAAAPALALEPGSSAAPPDLGALYDRLGNRLGFHRLTRASARASHIPERAVSALSLDARANPAAFAPGEARGPRPILLLPAAEPVDVIAEAPEGAPRQFRWRRVLYAVAEAEGPERIAPEWWQTGETERTRDYYCVADADGRRFWIYRDGLYGEEAASPRWYMHGVFA